MAFRPLTQDELGQLSDSPEVPGFLSSIGTGITKVPEAIGSLAEMLVASNPVSNPNWGSDVFNLTRDPQKLENVLRNTGSMAAGVAGAETGAMAGAPFAPFTMGLSIPLLAVLGGGAGVLGYNKLNQLTGSDAPTSPQQDIQQLGENTGTGLGLAALGATLEGVKKIPAATTKVKSWFQNTPTPDEALYQAFKLPSTASKGMDAIDSLKNEEIIANPRESLTPFQDTRTNLKASSNDAIKVIKDSLAETGQVAATDLLIPKDIFLKNESRLGAENINAAVNKINKHIQSIADDSGMINSQDLWKVKQFAEDQGNYSKSGSSVKAKGQAVVFRQIGSYLKENILALTGGGSETPVGKAFSTLERNYKIEKPIEKMANLEIQGKAKEAPIAQQYLAGTVRGIANKFLGIGHPPSTSPTTLLKQAFPAEPGLLAKTLESIPSITPTIRAAAVGSINKPTPKIEAIPIFEQTTKPQPKFRPLTPDEIASLSAQKEEPKAQPKLTISKEPNIDSLVKKVIAQESKGDHRAVSKKGAQGLMQLMPATGKALARELGVSYRPFDAEQNKKLGTMYLKKMLTMFNGNIAHALAAYNMGPEGFRRFLRGERRLPTETRNYVRNIIGEDLVG